MSRVQRHENLQRIYSATGRILMTLQPPVRCNLLLDAVVLFTQLENILAKKRTCHTLPILQHILSSSAVASIDQGKTMQKKGSSKRPAANLHANEAQNTLVAKMAVLLEENVLVADEDVPLASCDYQRGHAFLKVDGRKVGSLACT